MAARPRATVRHTKGPRRFDDDLDRRRDDSDTEGPLELKVPLVLLGIGLAAMAISAFTDAGTLGVAVSLAYAAVILFVQIPVTVLSLYIMAALLEITYGYLSTAVLKLAAITLFVEGLAFAGTLLGYPLGTRLLLIPVGWFLFSLLFSLNFMETFYSILGLGIISSAINWLLTMVVRAMMSE